MKTINYYENRNFTGTESYFKISNVGLIATDGVIDTFEKFQCFWLGDIIASYLHKLGNDDLYVCKFDLDEKGDKGMFYIEDGNNNVIIKQKIKFTDIIVSIKLFLSTESPNSILLLPSEY